MLKMTTAINETTFDGASVRRSDREKESKRQRERRKRRKKKEGRTETEKKEELANKV